MNTQAQLVLVIVGLLFIFRHIPTLLLYLEIRKRKRFLRIIKLFESTEGPTDYSDFKKEFHSAIKMLRRHKEYKVAVLFGEYLTAIKSAIDSARSKKSDEQVLLQRIGYTQEGWHLLCKSIDKTHKDEMMLKQLFWWPALASGISVNSIAFNR